eukprot:7238430-Prymnesium_polylepis.1
MREPEVEEGPYVPRGAMCRGPHAMIDSTPQGHGCHVLCVGGECVPTARLSHEVGAEAIGIDRAEPAIGAVALSSKERRGDVVEVREAHSLDPANLNFERVVVHHAREGSEEPA